ncbi:hypothetical protein [Nocardia sp. NPDC003345]
MAVLVATSSCSLAESASDPSILDGMTEERMCGLVRAEAVEQALGIRIGSPEAGRVPGRTDSLSYDCEYFPHEDDDGNSWQIATALGGTLPEESDKEALDGEFTDLRAKYAEPGETVAPYSYQAVPGLGTVAGYGEIPLFGHRVAAVFDVGDERLVVTVSTRNAVGPEQLTPLADELIANLRK